MEFRLWREGEIENKRKYFSVTNPYKPDSHTGLVYTGLTTLQTFFTTL